ncbi:MAG TPA: RdgB/HAM1 family non-canonical purine NTP pyrophosphatase [Xanthomonadales bacterium]|nr:RdgB/HAM1 family non-canonical purine NTP pyrophosphatase [Xanthomonadales bacterium]
MPDELFATSTRGARKIPRRLVLASGNQGKLRELDCMLRPLGWNILLQSGWGVSAAIEDGLTFIENALIKARHAARRTGLAALGDDSGLVVDALDGAPGIHSSRYAGENARDADNNRKLLDALRGVPTARRSAHFYCAMALVQHPLDPAPLLATGSWEGRIVETGRGAGGFGYDPLFWVEANVCTAAELDSTTKNQLSHRGQALRALVRQMETRQWGNEQPG